MLSKSTLQKIRKIYVSKKGSVLFDHDGMDKFHIAILVLVDATFGRSVVITLSTLFARGELRIHSFDGSITFHEIKEIEIAINENEQEK